jgi:hypothetical protein
MAGNHIAAFADEDRVGEAEGADAARDLRHLGVAVGPGIADKGDEPIERPVGDLKVARRFRQRLCWP